MRHISRETYVPSYFVIHSFMTKVETGQTYWTEFDLRHLSLTTPFIAKVLLMFQHDTTLIKVNILCQNIF